MDPYMELASGIIKQAVVDLKTVNRNIDKCKAKIAKYEITANPKLEKEEVRLRELRVEKKRLMQFFNGAWFEGLCDFIGLDSEYLTRAIKERNISGKGSINNQKAL